MSLFSRFTLSRRLVFGGVAVWCGFVSADAGNSGRAGTDFFESRIRPVLAERCYECHAEDSAKIKGGLVLDSKAGWRVGGDSGPAIVPGKPRESLLYLAVSSHPDVSEMPPKERLPKSAVADFEKWISMGAPDPRTEKTLPGKLAGDPGINIEAGRKFWSFRPVVKPEVPPVKNESWPRNEIDRFVLARLEKEGLEPGADAAPDTLRRRLHFDLTGLPPDREQATESPPELIDRLLGTRGFGEHWGRHWLDLARYADSNGGDINLTFPHAWRYRNYVIDAFNNDKPFDQFIKEQLAGDLMEPDPEKLVATGFLILGSKMLSERNKEKMHLDIADEQIDTVGRVFLGLTLGCARCHDHKFDPVPTSDYYALAGIFRSTVTSDGIRMGNVNVSGWSERELPVSGALAKEIAVHREQVSKYEEKLKSVKGEVARLEKKVGESDTSELGVVVDDTEAELVGNWTASTLKPHFFGKGYVHDLKEMKGEKSVTFTPDLPESGEYEVRLGVARHEGHESKVPVVIRHGGGEAKRFVDETAKAEIGELWDVLGRFRFEKGKGGSVAVSTEGTTGHVIADAVQWIPVAELSGGDDEDTDPERVAAQASLAEMRPQIKELEKIIKELKGKAPKAPKAMAAKDRKPEEIGDIAIRVRGEPGNKGKVAPRGFVQVATDPERLLPEFSDSESGRNLLADWIADGWNPLTARVMVNRIWKHLFGEGLVRSVDDFGTRGDRPSHPELLDWLAADFVENGWSVKHTVRLITNSRTYQLRSGADTGGKDPENRLLAHQNRRRLPAESIRDALLVASGQLVDAPANSAVGNLGEQAITNSANNGGSVQDEGHRGRSIYLPLVRNDMPPFLEIFDMANADVATGRRNVTTVPAQALLMLNSGFVRKMSDGVAEDAVDQAGDDSEKSITIVYEKILNRPPSASEISRAESYLRTNSLASFAQVLFASTEFRYLD